MTHQWSPPLVIALLLSLVAGLAASAAGQNIPMLDEHASLCAIFQALSPTPPTRCQERARSIVLRPPAEADPGLAAPASPPAPAARVYAFTTRIPFAWDSARLAPAAHQLLDTLAEVLQDALMADKIIRIEGHTDSAGSDAYNQRLSYRRAMAVQQYLVDAHGLPRARLPVVGRGKAELYDPAHPFAPSNRRVEFVNLTDSTARP